MHLYLMHIILFMCRCWCHHWAGWLHCSTLFMHSTSPQTCERHSVTHMLSHQLFVTSHCTLSASPFPSVVFVLLQAMEATAHSLLSPICRCDPETGRLLPQLCGQCCNIRGVIHPFWARHGIAYAERDCHMIWEWLSHDPSTVLDVQYVYDISCRWLTTTGIHVTLLSHLTLSIATTLWPTTSCSTSMATLNQLVAVQLYQRM